jgi:hypothetical protein
LDVAVLGSIPFALELRALHMPHVSNLNDVVMHTAEGEPIPFNSIQPIEDGVLEFGAVITRPAAGLLRLQVGSRLPLEGSGGDTRQLGLPFVQLRSRPLLAADLG